MTSLLYRGPGLDGLHSDYAMRGRIDARAPVTTRREVLIAAPPQTVWALLSGPLLPLYFGSGKLGKTLDAWLAAVKAAAERVVAGRVPE